MEEGSDLQLPSCSHTNERIDHRDILLVPEVPRLREEDQTNLWRTPKKSVLASVVCMLTPKTCADSGRLGLRANRPASKHPCGFADFYGLQQIWAKMPRRRCKRDVLPLSYCPLGLNLSTGTYFAIFRHSGKLTR